MAYDDEDAPLEEAIDPSSRRRAMMAPPSFAPVESRPEMAPPEIAPPSAGPSMAPPALPGGTMAPPVRPIGAGDQYRSALMAPPEGLHGWRKALAPLFVGMAAYGGGPGAGREAYENAYVRPEERRMGRLKAAAEQERQEEEDTQKRAEQASIQAERGAQTARIQKEIDEGKQAPSNREKTVETAEGVFQWNDDTGRYDIRVGGPKGKTPEKEKDIADWLEANNLPDAAGNRDRAREAIGRRGKEDVAPGTWQLQRDDAGNAVMFNSKTGAVKPAPPGLIPKGEKPTADEQRRADLANNMNENLTQLEDILKRRPELFGPFAGRWTQAKGAFGTSDPDIAALSVLREQLGMAMVGAHAMRNAQHVEAAAQSILGNFHNQPEAMTAAIEAARKSLETFQQDAARARRGGANAGPTAETRVHNGYNYTKQKDGTWKRGEKVQ